ncbi:hypothetical protein C1X05_00125 [Laceyella sacchari]|jgi:hypothetical protein|uniref:Uncharacterized protein n=1 Tax=Laceyella tengchongensis TaxID=574699 RepID=A0AA46AG38_9BACL|nr:hypothetical protein [Laceyella tengchongensis]AUS07418.1 hypothetical protein C1X05_00125 [Laceyella sacchari]SMP25201.1 hypothetical protein SAMN06265361_10524 [Laceyella tengchongensis]
MPYKRTAVYIENEFFGHIKELPGVLGSYHKRHPLDFKKRSGIPVDLKLQKLMYEDLLDLSKQNNCTIEELIILFVAEVMYKTISNDIKAEKQQKQIKKNNSPSMQGELMLFT